MNNTYSRESDILDLDENQEYLLSVFPQHANLIKAKFWDKKAQEQVIEENINNIKKIVCSRSIRYYWQWEWNKIEYYDLFNAGIVWILEAIQKTHINNDTVFERYCFYYIKNNILKTISTSERILCVSQSVQNEFLEVRKVYNEIQEETGNIPAIEELASIFWYTENRILSILEQTRKNNTISLNEHVFNNWKLQLHEIIKSDSPTPEEELYSKEFIQKVQFLIENSRLTEKEKKILSLRYWLNNTWEAKGFKEIWKILWFSGETIRQIHLKAMKKLWKDKMARSLKDYLQ